MFHLPENPPTLVGMTVDVKTEVTDLEFVIVAIDMAIVYIMSNVLIYIGMICQVVCTGKEGIPNRETKLDT